MVIITHDPRDVDALAQAIVAIDGGRVVDAPGGAPDVSRLAGVGVSARL
jgi:ABC-type thiamine transport system ATPase subunit